jgi:hypothetical protein
MYKIIKNIELSVLNKNNLKIYTKVKKNLYEYPHKELLKICEDHIVKDNILPKKIENKNNFYEKFYLFENNNFSLILIKWNKNCETRIHDHPEKGCIVRLLNGELIEEIYNSKLNKIDSQFLKIDNFGYKSGSKILHKIIAQNNAISLHVYIPGFFSAKYY